MTEDERSLIEWFVNLPVGLKSYLQAHTMHLDAVLQSIPMDYIMRSKGLQHKVDILDNTPPPISDEDVERLKRFLNNLPKED